MTAIAWQHIYKIAFRGAMTGNSPTVYSSKLGTKRHILTDKNGIPLSTAVISSANTHDIKVVTDIIDNTVVKRPSSSCSPKRHNIKETNTIIYMS